MDVCRCCVNRRYHIYSFPHLSFIYWYMHNYIINFVLSIISNTITITKHQESENAEYHHINELTLKIETTPTYR